MEKNTLKKRKLNKFIKPSYKKKDQIECKTKQIEYCLVLLAVYLFKIYNFLTENSTICFSHDDKDRKDSLHEPHRLTSKPTISEGHNSRADSYQTHGVQIVLT